MRRFFFTPPVRILRSDPLLLGLSVVGASIALTMIGLFIVAIVNRAPLAPIERFNVLLNSAARGLLRFSAVGAILLAGVLLRSARSIPGATWLLSFLTATTINLALASRLGGGAIGDVDALADSPFLLYVGLVTAPLSALFAAQFTAAYPAPLSIGQLRDRLTRPEPHRWPQVRISRLHASLISRIVHAGWVSAAAAAAIMLGSVALLKPAIALMIAAVAFVMPGLWSIQILIRKYRDAEAKSAERRSFVWISLGFVVGLWLWYPVAGLTMVVIPDWLRHLWTLTLFAGGQIAMIICLYCATFWAGSFDPALVVRRSTLYGTLSITLVFVISVVEEALSDLVLPTLGLPNRWSVWITCGVVAVLVGSLHNRYRSVIDKCITWIVSRTGAPG